jgi:protein-L-isoaspartate(D-aspartate) O-methyltransferase
MHEEAREALVRTQLLARGIIDQKVLTAMRTVERHRFVNEENELYAYEDRPIPIGLGQTISQPFMVALMTQTLGLTGDERVLEIGTGSGYQTAILAELAQSVFTIERLEPLQKHARRVLDALGYTNIHYKVGDGTLGWRENEPYDRILVSAGAPRVPEKLFEQMAVGGKMVAPIGGRFTQELNLVVKKAGGTMKIIPKGGCVFVPLIGKNGWTDDRADSWSL